MSVIVLSKIQSISWIISMERNVSVNIPHRNQMCEIQYKLQPTYLLGCIPLHHTVSYLGGMQLKLQMTTLKIKTCHKRLWKAMPEKARKTNNTLLHNCSWSQWNSADCPEMWTTLKLNHLQQAVDAGACMVALCHGWSAIYHIKTRGFHCAKTWWQIDADIFKCLYFPIKWGCV